MIDYSNISQLPNEILLRIIQYLSGKDVVLSVCQVSRRWRALVKSNLSRVPRIPAHCHVYVMDIDPTTSEDNSGRNPIIQYEFTAFDTSRNDYKKMRRSCLRGNDEKLRGMYVHNQRSGGMEVEWYRGGGLAVEKLETEIALSLLSFLELEGLRFHVYKRGRKLMSRRTDERLAHAVAFCEDVCGKVDPRALLLSSQNQYFAWCLGPLSLRRLSSFHRLDSLVLENMTGTDLLSSGKDGVDIRRLKFLRLKFDPKHQQEVENMLWIDLDGSLLLSLASAHVRNLDFNAFGGTYNTITAITARDMCEFIKTWRWLRSPWLIRSITFNSAVTISEFRTVAYRMGIFGKEHLIDIPYCRFRTFHPSNPSAKLELSCYGNGMAVQWSFRSGYLSS